MSLAILTWALAYAQAALAAALCLAGWRVLNGPRAQDRVLALDTLYVNAMLLILSFGISAGSRAFFETALVIDMLGFVSTAAAAKFLLRGEVIE